MSITNVVLEPSLALVVLIASLCCFLVGLRPRCVTIGDLDRRLE